MKVDGPDLMKEEMDGWDEKKGGYVCVCVRETDGERRCGLGKAAQPDEWGEER